ncbi:hypothetical protein ACS0TY_015770 [Phlomoides rotata]
MRSGGCAVNQALNTEAASAVKQAATLAKRRGHAQVTPLHLANAMLAVSGGLLRAACMRSHSHPLQCKALELCFNVALNRLPSGPTHSQYPSISNALVAAFKRAQAHQRRGSAESPSQPILAAKVELEQLVISVLDDPSVSRVMREAGFSSTQVKTNVEKVVSTLELPPSSNLSKNSKSKESTVVVLDPSPSINGDLQTLVETMLMSRKKRSFVVVGESISDVESTVRELMDRVDKGGVPEGLKEVKFITIPPFYSFCNLDKELVEQKMGELGYLVKNLVGRGVVLYLGDLNWVSEYRANLELEKSYYCSVEHMIMEIGKLISEIGEIGRFWIMGIATFQTYIRCKNGYNSLESIWRLNPVTIPANSLGLSLISQSCNEHTSAREVTLTCCPDCWSKFEAEAENINQNELTLSSSSSSLPPWLKDESKRLCNNNQKNNESSMMKLTKKWNTFCASSSHITLTSPNSSTSCFLFDPYHLSLSKPDPNSPSSSNDVVHTHTFKEFSSVNLNILCNALEKKVPWQREIIPEIAGTVLQCRSGMAKRRVNDHDGCKADTWLVFLGPDSLAKRKIATCLAKVVFGSSPSFVSVEKFDDSVSENANRVFFVDGLEKAGYRSQIRVKRAIESGRMKNDESGEEVSLCEAIVVLSCERFGCRSMPESSPREVVGAGNEERSPRVLLDLNSSFHDGNVDEHRLIDDLGILENIDRVVVFKIQNI